MEDFKLFAFAFISWGFVLSAVQCQCLVKNELSGNISDSVNSHTYNKCWNIYVPADHFILLKLTSIKSQHSCNQAYVKTTVLDTGEEYKFCSSDRFKNPITALRSVTVTHFIDTRNRDFSSFTIEYIIRELECLNNNSFRCNIHSCIPQNKVCDDVKDCKNGEDEIGCETGVLTIDGVEEARESAVSWLKSQRTSSWGWKENTPRAVVALYLATDVNFNGTDLEEELMAKQTELKTAVALLRPLLTNSELSMFVNALLVTCHNPRKFYGQDLVKQLKEQVAASQNSTHPAAYLALCNADESWPPKAISDLNSVLNTESEYPFARDLQAMAVMAVSCFKERLGSSNTSSESTNLTSYQNTVKYFKDLQHRDGSFGNFYTTALITQALISSGQEGSKDWNLNSTIKYLMEGLNSTSVDLLSVYLALPILKGKSLMDISKINCSAHPRKHGKDPVSEVYDYIGPKIRVDYSLYIGDDMDVMHSISLRVPENYTAFQVMEIAQVENPKYRFEWKQVSGTMYVYQIANVTNDPEAGHFWQLFLNTRNGTGLATQLITSPDQVTVADGDGLFMWYKTVSI